MTRVLIADDHEVVRSGLRAILEAHAGWEIVAEAGDGKEAIDKAITTARHRHHRLFAAGPRDNIRHLN